MFAPLRREELGVLVESLKNSAASGEVVDLSELVAEVVEKMVFRMVLGRVKDDKLELKRLIQEALNLVGAFNLADYMPWLGLFDLQDKHQSYHIRHDRWSIRNVFHNVRMGHVELSRHPSVMKRLQHELEHVVGMNKHVEENDLQKLSYLNMVVKETLRHSWKGLSNFTIWFGSKRVPGIHLGLTTVSLVLAQLVHCFDWMLPLGMSCDELDMQEIFGLSIPRKNHLLTRPVY
ncbi:hypothetical protein ACSQ67_009394 [Phaseolus vulgaris]